MINPSEQQLILTIEGLSMLKNQLLFNGLLYQTSTS